MTTTETLKLALEALENAEDQLAKPYSTGARYAITALREALASEAIEQKSGIKQVIELYDSPAQPAPATPLREQEPVRVTGFNCVCGRRMEVSAEQGVIPAPQRQLVGLTDEEIDQGLLRSDYAFKTAEAWRAGVVFAMTKLKEKNT